MTLSAPGPDALALGIDIGGTNTVFGIVGRDGRIACRGRVRTASFETFESFVAGIYKAVHRMASPRDLAALCGIGIGAPNANHYTGDIELAANLPWQHRLPLSAAFRTVFGQPVAVTNDANAAAIGEMHYGVARGMRNFIAITIGTGLGSGFVANGALIYGHDGAAGELGHTIAERDGRPCGCGRNGCLEKYVSAGGVVQNALDLLTRQNVPSSLLGIRDLNAGHIHDAAVKGDRIAISALEHSGRILGRTLADVTALFVPEAYIFSGGVSRAGAMILDAAASAHDESVLHVWRGEVKMLLSGLPDADAALLGAAGLVWSLY